jgi:2,4-dienoyl-CoA reductase-like NADH-dependent reductase (Old Yellow Enzyme family)
MTPHLGRLSPQRYLDYLRERIPGGAALVVTPAGGPTYGASVYAAEVAHSPEGYAADQDALLPWAPAPDALAAWEPTRRFLGEVAGIVHDAGSLVVGQIHHPGAERSWDTFQPVLAPSAIDGEWPAQHPHVLTDDEVEAVVAGYVANARLIVGAGLDGVEVHASHGYLLNRFLSPAYNLRTGRYAGWRILREIVDGIREAVGPEPLLGVRLPAFEEVPGGLTVADVAAGAASCSDGLDYANLSVGNHDGLAQGHPVLAYTSPWLVDRPSLLPASREIGAATGLPVLVTGGMTSARAIEDALAGGADLVGVARAVIADPGFVQKVLSGRDDEVAACIGCNECVLVPMACPVNPRASRERELAPRPVTARRRILVVGGGVAGLSAGLAARSRGHEVVVVERAAELGGRLADLVRDPARRRFASLLDRLRCEAEQRLDLRLSTDLTSATLEGYDAVVVATGARIAEAGFTTDGSVGVLTSADVLRGDRPPDGPVVVVGGTEPHVDPLLTALLLAGEGREVWLTTALPAVAPGVEQRTLNHLLRSLRLAGVRTQVATGVDHVAGGRVVLHDLLGGVREPVPAAGLVLAHTRISDPAPAELARASGLPTYVVGDALAPRRITHAVLEGTRFGSAI